jgi:hypothetical protein
MSNLVRRAVLGTGSLQADIDSKIPLAQKGVALGVAPLDATAKIPVTYLPIGVKNPKGTWNADTNVTSTGGSLASGVGTVGDTWIVTTPGNTVLDGETGWLVDDQAIFMPNNTWNRIPSGGKVAQWGSIIGTLSSQTDLQAALDACVKTTGTQVIDGSKTFNVIITGSITGNAGTATTLQTPRTINGILFDGSTNISLNAVTPNVVTFNNSGTGGASGVTFDGSLAQTVSYNTIGAPSITGTNASGTWGIAVTGNAGTATTLQTPRAINSVAFDGSADITVTAATPSAVTFSSGFLGANSGITFNGSAAITVDRKTLSVPSTTGSNASGTWGIAVTGNAGTATVLQTARLINGVSFNGSADITVTAATPSAVTFNSSGTGGASGTTFNGSAAQTISYNTIGAPSITGANASGTWGISVTGNAGTATVLQTARLINGVSFNGSANINVNTNNAVTFNNSGAGAVSGTTFNGSAAQTISYNTVGAPGVTGSGASGTWGISITGNSATATNVNYSPPANSIYSGATTVSTALTNYDSWDPLSAVEGFVVTGALAGGTGSINHPLSSVQTAVNNAASSPNNYIVFPGTFVENVTIPSGTIVRLRAAHPRPAVFLGSFSSTVLNGTLTVNSGTALIEGFQISQAATISVTAGTITFISCTFQNTVTISGATGASIIFKGCYFSSGLTYSSSNSACQIQMTECTGVLNSQILCTTDLSLLYIDNCVNMPHIDYRGNNLYINRLLSIGKNPGTGFSIKQRGNGLVPASGTVSIFNSNLRGDGTFGLDLSCSLLYYEGVMHNPGSNSIVATTKITSSVF